MAEPNADELAAIAAAYVELMRRTPAPAPPAASRWSLAGRLAGARPETLRFAASSATRWNAAGRLDG